MRTLIRYSILFYHTSHWLLGVGIFVLAIHIYTQSELKFDGGTIANPFRSAVVVLIFSGLVLCAVSLVGFYMTCLEKQPLIEVTLACALLMDLTTAACTYITRPEPKTVESTNQLTMMHIIWNSYGVGAMDEPEIAIDRTQRAFACCGFDNYSNWRFSKFSQFQEATYRRYWGAGILRILDERAVIPDHLLPEFYHLPMSCCREQKQDFDCIRTFAVGRKSGSNQASETATEQHNINTKGCSGQMAYYVSDLNKLISLVIWLSLTSCLFPVAFLLSLLLANELGARSIQSGVAGAVVSVGGVGLPHVFRIPVQNQARGVPHYPANYTTPNIVIERY